MKAMGFSRIKWLICCCFIFISSCADHDDEKEDTENAKAGIAAAEKAFAEMAGTKGIAEAFWFFADSLAVIKRENDSLISGRENIRNYYSNPVYKRAKVNWSPDFISASEEGDWGYTYGKYNWQFTDSAGKINEYKGIFHTVWKKMKDGSWRYVWD